MIRTLRFTGLLLLNASTVRGRLAGEIQRGIVTSKTKNPRHCAGFFMLVARRPKTDKDLTHEPASHYFRYNFT